MYANFSILFFIRKTRILNNKVPIYLRVTVQGKRAEISVRRRVLLSIWNSTAGKATGNSSESQMLNRYLNKVENNIYKSYQRLLDQEKSFTAKDVVDLYAGKKEETKMLLQIFQEHNDQVNKLIGKDFAAGTAERYRTAKMHVENYINKKYKTKDIPVEAVDHKFITGLEYYLKTERNCAHNSAIKYNQF